MITTARHIPSIDVDLELLEHDPYPFFDIIRQTGPIAWIEPLKMWYVVGYQEVRSILMDDVHFSTGTPHSLLFDTFGEHMLTQNGADHLRARKSFRGAFAPSAIRAAMAANVRNIIDSLIDGFSDEKEIDLRSRFAARLPILAILKLFGFDGSQETALRHWYDRFEKALANFTWNETVREEAKTAVAQFHSMFRTQIDAVRLSPGDDLLSAVVHDRSEDALSDEEIILNASIIFFGGISTVEALILNTLYACALHKIDLRDDDPKLIDSAIEETMRWLSPVQSATRHVVAEIAIGGVTFAPGDTVNCMLGAANRDPAMFVDANLFNPARRDVSRHLGFATGSHFCLGLHLARLQAKLGIERLLERLSEFSINNPSGVAIQGYEFRQPRTLIGKWSGV